MCHIDDNQFKSQEQQVLNRFHGSLVLLEPQSMVNHHGPTAFSFARRSQSMHRGLLGGVGGRVWFCAIVRCTGNGSVPALACLP